MTVKIDIFNAHTSSFVSMTSVHYNVPRIRQSSSNTCWLACFRMLAMFRLQVGRPLNPYAQVLLNPDYIALLERRDQALDPRRFASGARQFGLSALDVPGLTSLPRDGIVTPYLAFDILRRRGPFTLGGLIRGRDGHAIVICGANDTRDMDIEFIDPRFGVFGHVSFPAFQRGFPPDGGPLFVF